MGARARQRVRECSRGAWCCSSRRLAGARRRRRRLAARYRGGGQPLLPATVARSCPTCTTSGSPARPATCGSPPTRPPTCCRASAGCWPAGPSPPSPASRSASRSAGLPLLADLTEPVVHFARAVPPPAAGAGLPALVQHRHGDGAGGDHLRCHLAGAAQLHRRRPARAPRAPGNGPRLPHTGANPAGPHHLAERRAEDRRRAAAEPGPRPGHDGRLGVRRQHRTGSAGRCSRTSRCSTSSACGT